MRGERLRWILGVTKPNQEAIAVYNLERQGYVPYCPKFKELRQGKLAIVRPLFPRYLFIGIEQAWYSIKGTRGISHLLMGDNGPQCVPDSIIKGIRDREFGGLVSLEKQERFAHGATVKCTQGPLVGMELIYQGMTGKDRCAVLAQMLGGAVKVELEEKSLVAA